jgi:baseplate J-like protein
MPLPNPILDTRRFDQLVNEGRALIPRLAPQWTDHNASDPGITLLELGAWLAEQNIYRLDRLSEEAIRAFVRLVGIEPKMPGVARTVVSIVNNNTAGVALPARVQLATAKAPLFETTEPLFISPAGLTAMLTGRGTLIDVTESNNTLSEFFAFGLRPRIGHALYLGFDHALNHAGGALSLHVWTPTWQKDAATRERLIAEHDALAKNQLEHCCPPPDWRNHYRVRTMWEFYAGGNAWLPLTDVVDETRALTLTGFVRFTAPVSHQAGGPGSQFFIRCRIVSGRFECPPQLTHVAFNAVRCEHALSATERSVGLSRGHAHATFSLGTVPVVTGSVKLSMDNGVDPVQTDWHEAPDFERAGAHDRVFTLNPERGELQSGDGLRAQVLPAGYQLWASFQVGSGPDGNIEAGSLTTIPANAANLALAPLLGALAMPLVPVQRFAARGGTARETLAEAQARAFDRVSEVDKAVTLEDIERLALATPGVPIARVHAVANLEPHLPCYPAPGVITLIVIPPCPKPAPMPSRALLDAVELYLEPRRLVTSEIRAIAPHYRRIAVSATLHLTCEAEEDAVFTEATTRLNRFLSPLDSGPESKGWSFGRTVYRSEMMALLADTPGVARVTALTLQTGRDLTGSGNYCGPSTVISDGRCDNIELCGDELVIPGRHRLIFHSEILSNLRRSNAHECEPA